MFFGWIVGVQMMTLVMVEAVRGYGGDIPGPNLWGHEVSSEIVIAIILLEAVFFMWVVWPRKTENKQAR